MSAVLVGAPIREVPVLAALLHIPAAGRAGQEARLEA